MKKAKEIPSERPCNKCHVVKPLDEFYKAPNGKYGRQGNCISCMTNGSQKKARMESDALAERGLKRCIRCKEVKPLDAFTPTKTGLNGKHPVCRPCRNAEQSKARKQAAGLETE